MFQGFLTWEFIPSSSVYYIKFWIKKLSLQKNLFWKSQIQPIFEKGEK
ncbi:hypothetical protein LEP1GSC034_2363 [Leptospira interrogans str. 2003000735]|uniref:Uncharacterized protein n=12 Tax=Leptospira interrogans TaxID=173 RepID=A0A0E2D0Q6_LEPIR|nr:hypothetical protein LEP1GSC045_2579 [Leptospira interrogans serovar Pomona str. Kennewicki LC82-25]EJP02678.1 hypothetical protein LEP1GSC007_4228 [Leptospira interrogans serovar Bulgarica str. Mallika]EJP15642.1 hypothetical protein LEP1GSC080_3890 [Leptospira interrogans str. FPW2026]EKN87282.1 hypothetical protein LEP1GSC027_3204 [Leptospira interrogans str. 2002000624]EKN99548.1 hypothetical protein LEP1GSC014_3072 [Leptospira interrogans serovar Pomona str. Pomona]EKO06180.1 hypotheti